MKAIGVHALAGGMTIGVQQAGFDVKSQLETLSLGTRTVAEVLGVGCYNAAGPQAWPSMPKKTDLMFGNPRCSGFSLMSTGRTRAQSAAKRGSDESCYGANAYQTIDVKQMVDFGIVSRPAYFVFESVQNATTVGWPLIRSFADRFLEEGYSVAHLLYSNATFGVPQQRRRYLFVASRRGCRFGAELPEDARTENDKALTTWQAIGKHSRRKTRPVKMGRKTVECRPDDRLELDDERSRLIPYLEEGWSFNHLVFHKPEAMDKENAVSMREKWDRYNEKGHLHNSPIGFDTNNCFRLKKGTCAPTLHKGCNELVHPKHNRTLSIRELCALMAWPSGVFPIGPHPHQQLARGVAPPIGRWLAGEIAASMNKDRKHHEFEDADRVDPIGPKEVVVSWNKRSPSLGGRIIEPK